MIVGLVAAGAVTAGGVAVAADAVGGSTPPAATTTRSDPGTDPGLSTPGAAFSRIGPPAQLRWRSIRVDGVPRRYLLSVPAGLRGPAPLVIAFHGIFEYAGGFAAFTGLFPATRARGEVLIVPESAGPVFNDGRLGPRGPDDQAFTVALLDRWERSGLVDPARVTVAGFSNGAGMAMAVAAAHPGRVAAVVAVDGELIARAGAPRPTGPVAAVLIHGTDDRVQPWLGRRGGGRDYPPYVSVMDTVAAWVAVDHAGDPATTSTAAGDPRHSPWDRRAADDRTFPDGVTTIRWQPGPQGAGVTFYRVAGMGHRWPITPGSPLRVNTQRAHLDATTVITATAATAHTTR